MSVLIKQLYYIRVVFIIVANLYTLKLCEQVSFCIKRCIIIFSLNDLSQLLEGHSVEFFFIIKCTDNYRLQKVSKASDNDLFNAFIVIIFK